MPAASFAEDREPTFDATVPRQFAHKRAVEEIFLTDIIVREGRGNVLACAQLPRSHALHNELDNGFHDLLLILETGRQGMTIYGHARLDIPEGTAFVMSGLRCEVVDLDAMRQGPDPAELVIEVPFGGERRDRRGRVRGYTLKGLCEIDGRPAVDFTGEALLIPAALYERVRGVRVEGGAEREGGKSESGAEGEGSARGEGGAEGEGSARGEGGARSRRPQVRVEPARVGRRSPRNVVVGDPVLGDGELRCVLVSDTTHPTFFDHPLDHVPGMLMLETARQAGLLYAGELGWDPVEAVLDACEARFTQYAALWPPASCRVRAGEWWSPSRRTLGGDAPAAQCLRVHFEQAGQDIGYIDLRLRRVGRRTAGPGGDSEVAGGDSEVADGDSEVADGDSEVADAR